MGHESWVASDPPFAGRFRPRERRRCNTSAAPPKGGRSQRIDPCGKAWGAPEWALGAPSVTNARLALALLAALAPLARRRWQPWPESGEVPALDLLAAAAPGFHAALHVWWYVAPAAAVFLAGSVVLALWRVWGPGGSWQPAGRLPPWPAEDPEEPLLVIGERHHPVETGPAPHPGWLTLPAAGLFTGVAVVGAVGSGKTAACMRPFARQLFGWQAGTERAMGGLVLEVKGDFCRQVREVLDDAGRVEDYVELGLGGEWSWNPLDAPGMDSYSLAYQIASLQNQLFGKGKEPFWQQAATNLVRWILELKRVEGGWVTLRDVYRLVLDDQLLANSIQDAARRVQERRLPRCVLALGALSALTDGIRAWDWQEGDGGSVWTAGSAERIAELREAGAEFGLAGGEADPGHAAERVDSIARWFASDWMALDVKLRSSIKEGIAVFLGLFEDPDVARTFCPPEPGAERPDGPRALPPMRELIEKGSVLALNMPPRVAALARICGTFLKTAWLQAALERPADMARAEHAGKWWRPAVFLCDEYQMFATVGEDDPSGDEKAFSLTRQARVIPIVATQSLTSLKAATRGGDAWKVLLQALRTRIFLSLSDADSARQASDTCGRVERMKASYSVSESGGRGGLSLAGRLSGAGGGVGASKSYKAEREALFEPGVFQRLDLCQAIVQPFDGRASLPARRVYLKPHFLPRELPYFEARRQGRL